jgi:hypothetical protein
MQFLLTRTRENCVRRIVGYQSFERLGSGGGVAVPWVPAGCRVQVGNQCLLGGTAPTNI